MTDEPQGDFIATLDDLVRSVQAMRSLGRRLSVREEKLVALAQARPQPRLRVREQPPADDLRPQGDEAVAAPESLEAVRAALGDCRRCKLAGGRKHIVFGEGNPRAELMFIGEAPGADEDRQGRPFVGRAGQLLTKMIEAMGKTREDVYIANILKCRPPDNRDPQPDEVEMCEPFLQRQIRVIRPRVIVALGRIAVQTLLKDATPIGRLRGRWHSYAGIRLMPTFHPAYLLRNPAGKKPAWEDLQQVMAELGWPLPNKKG
ncbi:MAG TPA: uracil-DNA glycosylase [bacterium]|nr:uracil-DNA glycosylase [bacterium]